MKSHSRSAKRKLGPTEQALVDACLHLIKCLAQEQFRLCKGKLPLEELVAEAGAGLVYAAGLFEACKGVPFGAYATLVIRQRLHHAAGVARTHRSHSPTFTDMGWWGKFKTGRLLIDLACEWTKEPSDVPAAAEMVERLRRKLPKRSFDVLRLHYLEGYSLAAIGRKWNVSRQRVRTILEKAREQAKKIGPEYNSVF